MWPRSVCASLNGCYKKSKLLLSALYIFYISHLNPSSNFYFKDLHDDFLRNYFLRIKYCIFYKLVYKDCYHFSNRRKHILTIVLPTFSLNNKFTSFLIVDTSLSNPSTEYKDLSAGSDICRLPLAQMRSFPFVRMIHVGTRYFNKS